MRLKIYEGSREAAVELFRRAEVVRVATTTPEGRPVLRTVHGVVAGDHVAFHGSPAGEKMEAVGREAVIGADEIVAEIPSWFLDPERACPATTYYRSAQASGPIESVEDPGEKGRILEALMARFQPEGRHVPIEADHPLYRAAVRGIAVLRVSLANAVAKTKMGQNRKPEELHRIYDALWARGGPRDLAALEGVREANPGAGPPRFLAGPEGIDLVAAADRRHLEGALRLLEGSYWNEGESPERIARAHLGSTAWVVATETGTGAVVGTARAIADGARQAWVYDVAVAPGSRGRGVGRALLALLLDHPRVRGARFVHLATRDAQAFYRPFGFVEAGPGVAPKTTMVLDRA